MKKQHIFDNPRNVKLLLMSFYGSCIVLVILNFFLSKHGHFSWEERSGFYAAYGFVACTTIILAAKYILRKIAKRREDYYD